MSRVPSPDETLCAGAIARGTPGNFDISRRDEEPPVEVLAQSDPMLRFKSPVAYRRFFKDGKMHGTTLDEYTRRMIVVAEQTIEAHLACAYRHEVTNDNVPIATLTKK